MPLVWFSWFSVKSRQLLLHAKLSARSPWQLSNTPRAIQISNPTPSIGNFSASQIGLDEIDFMVYPLHLWRNKNSNAKRFHFIAIYSRTPHHEESVGEGRAYKSVRQGQNKGASTKLLIGGMTKCMILIHLFCKANNKVK